MTGTELQLRVNGVAKASGAFAYCKSLARTIAKSSDEPKDFTIVNQYGDTVSTCHYEAGDERLKWVDGLV